MPKPYVALNGAEAARLAVNEGALLSFELRGQRLRLPLRVLDDLPLGLVGLPVGLPGVPAAVAGATVTALEEAAQ